MLDPQAQFVARGVLSVVAIYAAIGVVFALAFVVRGVARMDRAAAGSRWHFRLLILPGVAALWPVMMMKWKNTSGGAKTQADGEDRR